MRKKITAILLLTAIAVWGIFGLRDKVQAFDNLAIQASNFFTIVGTVLTLNSPYTDIQIGGDSVCLEDGTNCPASGAGTVPSFTQVLNVNRAATTTPDFQMGFTATTGTFSGGVTSTVSMDTVRLGATGNVLIGGTLGVTGQTSLGLLSFSHGTSTGAFDVGGRFSVGGTSAFTGLAAFGNITFSGATGTSLAVTGLSNLGTLTLTSGTSTNFAVTGLTTIGTLAGAINAGDAESFEIPNGAAPVVDAIGEIAFDSTDNQLLIATGTTAGTTAVIPIKQLIWSATFSSSSPAYLNSVLPLPIKSDAMTITEIRCYVVDGTSVAINVDTAAGGANSDALTCATTASADTAIAANAGVSAASLYNLELASKTGSINYVSFSIWGTIVRE